MVQRTIKRQSIGDQMLELIKASIFSLEYLPGTRLIVDTIAEQFNSSRTPVREALKKLVEHGLVEYNGNGYRVISLKPEDIGEIYLLRTPLEKLAVIQATQRMKPEEFVEIQQNSIKFFQENTLEKMIELDIEFHMLIAKASHNHRLENILGSLMDQLQLINRWLHRHKPQIDMGKMTIDEHIKILDCMKKGDSDGAAKAMEAHLQAAETRAII